MFLHKGKVWIELPVECLGESHDGMRVEVTTGGRREQDVASMMVNHDAEEEVRSFFWQRA